MLVILSFGNLFWSTVVTICIQANQLYVDHFAFGTNVCDEFLIIYNAHHKVDFRQQMHWMYCKQYAVLMCTLKIILNFTVSFHVAIDLYPLYKMAAELQTLSLNIISWDKRPWLWKSLLKNRLLWVWLRSALVEIMALYRTGDKTLSKPMMIQFSDASVFQCWSTYTSA